MITRKLLEERFALKSHSETQTIDVFALVPAQSDGKLGPKVQAWDGTCAGGKTPFDDDPKMPRCPTGYRPPGMMLEGVTMFEVAEMLSLPQPALGRIVEDRTGLIGRYTMELSFEFGPARSNRTDTVTESTGPSIYTVLQEQRGLKLEPTKDPLNVRVVDSAELPTEN